MKRVFRSRLFIACAASVATALAVGGVAWAVQNPIDSNRVVHACYNPANGDMRLNVTGSCPATGRNTPITWNAQGQPGAQGAQGPAGPAGPSSAASLRTIELGPASVPFGTAFMYPNPVDVHDCAQLTVTIKRSNNPPIAGVDFLANMDGEPLGYVGQAQSAGSVFGSGQTWTHFRFGGMESYSPYPSIFVSLFGGSSSGVGSTTVNNAWVICKTFGS
jgi:hypothetical protein